MAIFRITEHVVRAIERAPAGHDPFHHLLIDEVFPPDVYEDVLRAMPEAGCYRPMSGRANSKRHGHTTHVRTKVDLFPEWIRRFPHASRPVWEMVGAALRSAEVREAFARRLASGLERRFGVTYAKVGLYAVPVLVRDVPGYSIGIHPDTRWKGITVQLFLPRDRSMEHVGTIFHARDGDGFREVKRMRFLPNSGYAFAVGSDTYHSVDRLGNEVASRDSILLTYYVDRTPFQMLSNRAKRVGNGVRAVVGAT